MGWKRLAGVTGPEGWAYREEGIASSSFLPGRSAPDRIEATAPPP